MAEQGHRPQIATAVTVVGHVQRLMQVAHEVDEEPQCLGAVRGSRRGIGQHLRSCSMAAMMQRPRGHWRAES